MFLKLDFHLFRKKKIENRLKIDGLIQFLSFYENKSQKNKIRQPNIGFIFHIGFYFHKMIKIE